MEPDFVPTCGVCGTKKKRSPCGQWQCKECSKKRMNARYKRIMADKEASAAAKIRWARNAKIWKDRHPDRVRVTQRRVRFLRKMKVLKQYSDNDPKCDCCGERNWEFLTIDHIGGGGAEHRRQIGGAAGQGLYKWLINNGFPPGFRVLCFNCNTSLGHYGYCPHKPEVRIDIAAKDKRFQRRKEVAPIIGDRRRGDLRVPTLPFWFICTICNRKVIRFSNARKCLHCGAGGLVRQKQVTKEEHDKYLKEVEVNFYYADEAEEV